MDPLSNFQLFLTFSVPVSSFKTWGFGRTESCFGKVLRVFDFSVQVFNYQAVIRLLLEDVFNCQISSAELCIDMIWNWVVSTLPKIFLIQSRAMSLTISWGMSPQSTLIACNFYLTCILVFEGWCSYLAPRAYCSSLNIVLVPTRNKGCNWLERNIIIKRKTSLTKQVFLFGAHSVYIVIFIGR